MALKTFISNAAVNRLNIHSGLHALAWGLSGNFLVAFLLSHGFPVSSIFLYLAFIFGLRFALRPIVLWIAPRLGSRLTLYIGCGLFAVQYLVLSQVSGINNTFAAFCLISALSDIFYFTSYHAIFAYAGDDMHRGKQIGAREAIGKFISIIAPLAGGFAIDHIGPTTTFGIAAVIELTALLPLTIMPNLPIHKKRPKGSYSNVSRGVWLMLSDGWITVGISMVWTVMLFGSAGSQFTSFGGALALSGLVSALGGLFLGKIIDGGKAKYAVFVNGFLLIAALALRASAGNDWSAMLGITAVSSLLGASYMPILMTAVYKLAAKAPCPLRFVVAIESGWDIGCGGACLVTALLLNAGTSLGGAILFSILGAVLQIVLLHKFYKKGLIPKA